MKIPTVEEFRKVGYKIKVEHCRRYLVSEQNVITRKISYYTVYVPLWEELPGFSQLLPKGGITKVTVITPDNFEFNHESKCRNDENYNKKVGVNICLEKIYFLMLVCDGKDGFELDSSLK